MKDTVSNLKEDLLCTLSHATDYEDVIYYINGKEAKLHFDYSRTDNGYIEIYLTEEDK